MSSPSVPRRGPSRPGSGAQTFEAAALRALAHGLAGLRAALAALGPGSGPAAPDASHDLRVALRRVRTVLAIVAGLAPSARIAELRRRAADLAAVAGRARTWDVYVAETLVVHAPDPVTAGHARLVAVAGRLRAGARAEVAAELAGRDAAMTTTAFADLVARRGWHDGGRQGGAAPPWSSPLADLAPAVLDRLHARVLERGRGFARQGAAERHALRLAVKKLRYALDFFADAAGGGRRRDAFRRDLAALQRDLGHANDRAAARDLAAAVAAATDAEEALAALAALGPRLDDADRAAEPALIRDWRRFAARRPFWRA